MNNFEQNPNRKARMAGPEVKSTTGNGPQRLDLMSAGRKKSGRWWKYPFMGLLMIGAILAGAVTARTIGISNKIFVGNKTSFGQKIRALITGNANSDFTKAAEKGQINILLLGIGGEGHDGPYLSDTMILMQFRPQDSEVVLTSIPRDLLATLPKNYGQQKINAAFAQGFSQHHDWSEAGSWATQTVEKISGLDIPYFVVLDFSGFETAIDTVGGVDVHVDRTFTDYSYPKDGTDGYLPPVTFTEGDKHMDGKTALIFARSRHAAGFEGSDFARSLRQQKVINSLKEKVLSLNLVTDSGKLNRLLDILANHLHTNLTVADMISMYQEISDRNIHNFMSLSLDPSTQLICPEILPENGAYVLTPCPGKTNSDVENFFKDAFARARLQKENPVIWLSNSTQSKLGYQKADAILKNDGVTVWELAYKGEPLPKTIFYMVNPKPATADFLAKEFSAQQVTLPPPQVNIDKSKVDVILILGQDYSRTASTTEETQQ